MNKKELLEKFTQMEKQVGELYNEFGTLKESLARLIEENHHLSVENHHLRKRLDEQNHSQSNEKENQQQKEAEEKAIGEGYDNLARIYEEGFHICNVHFGSPRDEEDCLFCLLFLNKQHNG
ncbi:MAG: DNA replication initiation control protein YabA [Bacillaceae bacterium]|nr:DNA replication initiation control protein YabA [Bacillaceae bacterium]